MKNSVALLLLVIMLPAVLTSKSLPKDSLDYNPNMLFRSIGISALSELVYMNPNFYYYTYDNQVTNRRDSFLTAEECAGFAFIGCTYEWRKNLCHYRDRGSVSLSLPAEFGLVYFTNAGRLGELTFPLSLDLNYGMHSTWNNIDKIGGHLGIGYQLVLGGLFNTSSYGEGNFQSWTQPVYRAGIKFPVKRKNCFLDVDFSPGHTVTFISNVDPQYGYIHYRKTKSETYFKICFGWLIHYSD